MSLSAENNLKKIYSEEKALLRLKELVLCEEAKYLCRAVSFGDRATSFDTLANRYAESVSEMKKADPSFSIEDEITLCSYIAKEVLGNIPTRVLTEEYFGKPEHVGIPKIGYMQNAITDSVFLSFSDALGKARADYYLSFTSLCDAIEQGLTDYIILPYKSEDGILPTVDKLIGEHSLSVCLWINVEGTTYLLLSRAVCVLPKPKNALSTMLQLRISSAEYTQWIAKLAEMIGTKLSELYSLEANGVQAGIRVCLDITECDLPTLIAALSVNEQFVPCGIYYILN